jgi:hypothetical protein
MEPDPSVASVEVDIAVKDKYYRRLTDIYNRNRQREKGRTRFRVPALFKANLFFTR